MSVSTINAGSNQSALQGASPQRSNVQAMPGAASPATGNAAGQPAASAVPNAIAVPTRHANLVGVAAYAAIMNPSAPTSMRVEA